MVAEEISEKTKIPLERVTTILYHFNAIVCENLETKDTLKIPGFATFTKVTGVNPKKAKTLEFNKNLKGVN